MLAARSPWEGASDAVPRALSPGARQMVALAFLVLLAWMLLTPVRLLGDPDTYWHVMTGREILATGAMPRIDRHSHTFAGEPWIAKEWLSQVLLAAAWSVGGWGGVVLVAGLAYASAGAVLLAFLLGRVKGTVALVLLLLALPLLTMQAVARPAAAMPLLMALWAAGCLRALERGAAPSWWLVGLMALWANLHASFPVGLAIAALFGAEAVLTAPADRRLRLAARWLVFGLAALAATGATPYGYAPLLLSLEFAGGNEGVAYIQEWRPPLDGPAPVFALLLCAVALLALAPPRGNPPRLLPLLLVAVMAGRHARFLGLFAMVLPLCVAAPLARRLPALAPVREGIPASRPAGFAIAALAAACLAIAVLRPAAPDPAITPTAALDAARAAGVSGPVFNDYDFGGYLIWRGVPTFSDGRNDQLFRGGFTVAYFEAQLGADAALLELIARHGVTWALLRTGSRPAAALERAGWRRLHEDGVAVVLLPP